MSKVSDYSHFPVMLGECMNLLAIRPDGVYVDCTAGGGGHSKAILERLGRGGVLVSIDKDPAAVRHTSSVLEAVGSEASHHVLQMDFSQLDDALDAFEIGHADGILADLGVSSHQLDTADRGFGYSQDGPLDMRMNPAALLSAREVVNRYPVGDLARILREYGEERHADRIARAICRRREIRPFETTADLAAAVASAMPPQARREAQHPARRTFQAVRIEVNGELDALRQLLAAAAGRLADRGRLCILSFHSLEDRLGKESFRSWENPCTCPRDFPHCVCGAVPLGKTVSKRPVTAAPDELEINPRSRSAKLRAFERIIS
ncbi:MAG: 16S rRNA (cytosine(1402)-N(4))-methyltransferase RsmH [Clostridiaceae bacterium]|nr:16S rRNA (cytosine(1402)-N(4))-methyltransferase RsmH [Clostridiaceae bacterium]